MADRLYGQGHRKAMLLILLLVSFLLTFSSGSAAIAAEQLPVAKIVSVESPLEVSPGEKFIVTVGVDYSGSYSTDIAILDSATGRVLDSRGLIIPAGRNLFSFSLTGPEGPGVWSLLATVRVWWHSGWYANQHGGTYVFNIRVIDLPNAILNITSNLDSTVVRVDGTTYPIFANGTELQITRGIHRIEVEPQVVLGVGVRAEFDRWSDGMSSSAREIYVAGQLDLSAIYLTEFLLTVGSSAGVTIGSGWYPAGTSATFAALDPAVTGHPLMGYQATDKFDHWSGDSQSDSPVDWVAMDRPKTVTANWSEDMAQVTLTCRLVVVSIAFLSCSAMLLTVVAILRKKARMRSHRFPLGGGVGRGLLLVVLSLAVAAHSAMPQTPNASALHQPEDATIGDATWYHWNQAGSDTCLIWLGGGIVGQSAYMMNPLEYESYNTVRFVQDLAEYYDLLALKKGSMHRIDQALNKTVYGEPYPGSGNFMKEIRVWAHERGYTYLYVVGYSVGAMIAVEELILTHPDDWVTPDGLVVITTKIPERVYTRAGSLRACLLLLYGDKIAPEFAASGERFYQETPKEGWRDGFWFHKEYHVIPDVEHEVWTTRDSGEYDKRASLDTVKFIESSKGLQFEPIKATISECALNLTTREEAHVQTVDISSVKSPHKVRTEEAFRITATVRYDLPSNRSLAVLGFDSESASIVSVSQRRLAGTSQADFVITASSGNTTKIMQVVLIPLVANESNWVPITAGIKAVQVEVTDLLTVNVLTGYPNVVVELDGQVFVTNANGEVDLRVDRGEHVISVPPTVTLDNGSRAIFDQWNDITTSPILRVCLSEDVSLLAIYHRQWYLDVKSEFGQTTGTGWYDEYAVAPFGVAPLLISNGTVHMFVGWSGDSNDYSPRSSVVMSSSMNVQASWRAIESREEGLTLLQAQVLLVASMVILLVSSAFAITLLGHEHRPASADEQRART